MLDLDRDSIPEFVTADWVFAYWQTSFAFSARPPVVLRYGNGQYQLAPDLMKKAPPSDKEIDEAARQVCKIRNSTLWDETEFGKLTKYFTDLLYSGNLSKAERYLRRALCGNKQEQEDFLTEFSEKIKKGRCWPELSALTGDLVQ